MIWGEAGVGKTTFCSKFCQDWAIVVKEKEGHGEELTEEQQSELEKLTEEQRSKLNNIGLLIYIVLRNIDECAKNIDDIVSSQLGFNQKGTFMSQTGLKEQVIDVLENVIGHRHLTLLLDGFDEMSHNDEVIKCIIKGDSHQNLHCITTCRPHATHGLVLNVDVEIRLKGFSKAQANSFVEMYARIKYTNEKDITQFVSRTMSQIDSAAELLEMSTNPSMLQLLCLLSWKKGKIGKNRTSVFRYYTGYLLMQYHIKLGKTDESYSDDLYHQNLLDAGKVALMGLKQNQLQLVFSKCVAHRIGGNAIFDIGFLTELPRFETDDMDSDTDSKVQFTHKTLQEYLAAYYVVNSLGDEGLQLVMEFCCTSQRLMGSQIILEFVSNMSTKIEKKIQKQIQDYVSSWDSDDKVDPKSRTSFLISMLNGNKTLTFPLPAVVDIDLREFDFISHRFMMFFKFLYRQKSTLEKFFDMDGTGVKKLILILGEYNRMNILQNTTTDFVNELLIDCCNTWFKRDNEDLSGVMKKMKPGLLSITGCQRNLIDKETVSAVLQHVHTLILEKCDLDNDHLLIILKTKHQLKVLTVNESGAKIDGSVIEAVSKLSSDIKLYISGKESTLIHHHDTRKSLSMANCGIQIDTEIAEAVSRLPGHTELDLSGNQVTDKSACIILIHNSATVKSLSLCNCGIQIDTEIAGAVSRIPDHTQLDLSGNRVTGKSACIMLILKAATMKSLNIHNCMSNCGILVDTEIAEAVSRLPDHTELDLSSNQVKDKSACITLIHKAVSMKYLSICQCGIQIDTGIAKAVSRLPNDTQLDLSCNQVTDKSACITLIQKAATMKSLSICNCGIQIDTEIAEAVSRLPDFTELDLSGNDITKMNPYLLSRILSYMKKQERINIDGWGITVDEDFVRALSKLSKLQTLIINDGYYSNNKLTPRASSELPHTVSSMPHLQILYLDDCNISNDVMVALTDSLYKHCPLLEKLSLSYNHLSSGVWEVVEHIQQIKNLRELWLRGNPCVKDSKQRNKIITTLHMSNPGVHVYTL